LSEKVVPFINEEEVSPTIEKICTEISVVYWKNREKGKEERRESRKRGSEVKVRVYGPTDL
jgi:hypothetical protein